MVRYILGRLLAAIPVLLGVSVVVFVVLHLIPGDVAQLIASRSFAAVTPEQTAQMRHQLGLDDPLWLQYLHFLTQALTGDLGRSFYTNRPVVQSILEQFPATLSLAGAALGLSVVIGLSLGILAAVKHNTWIDNLAMTFSLGGLSIPIFWSGLMLIYLFSVQLNWLPITGDEGWKTLILPAVTLGYDSAAFIARMVRTSVLEVLHHDYVLTARAKGLSPRVVLGRHVMKAALIPIVTLIGLQAGRLLGGAVIVEVVFARQGVGHLAVEAIQYKDYSLVQGVVLLAAAIYVLVNLAVDVSYAWLNPR
ncbi:MAG TPA: nickel ABC transporter permease, partial [Chloroflexota bacterium]|nr:nickel ABC transporter permease [Chloroflexota bacterium]